MKGLSTVVLMIIGAGSFVAFGQDSRTSREGGAADLAKRLFSPDDRTISREQRVDAMGGLDVDYAAVREATLDVLRAEATESLEEIDMQSRLYDAMHVARVWRIREAQVYLTTLVKVRLNPASVPPGIQIPGTSFYPAAEALSALAGPPETLVGAMTEANSPYLLWAMTEAFGKRIVVAALRSHSETSGANVALLDKAISKVQSTNRPSDLLPAVLMKK